MGNSQKNKTSEPNRPGAVASSDMMLAILALVVLIGTRLLTLGTTDLIDPTESRYAFVAQEMVQSGDWLTPKLPLLSGLEAYASKPPFHYWLTAAAISLFGMDAWVTRLPSFLSMLVIALSVWLFSFQLLSQQGRFLAVIITLSSGLFFFISGSSTVDITFSATISAAIASFALVAQNRSARLKQFAGYAFFIALACAFLTKGPASLVLVGGTIFLWILPKAHRKLFPKIPWVKGGLLFLLITAPWFILFALKDSDFLYYYFVQENFLRYVSRDYGDRFGTGHVYPRGSAIWMLAVGFLPWTFVVGYLIVTGQERWQELKKLSPWILLALSWGLFPTLFFSLARQLHAAYLLPGFGGFGIVVAKLLEQRQANKLSVEVIGDSFFTILRNLSFITAFGFLVASFFFAANWLQLLACFAFALTVILLIKMHSVQARSLPALAIHWSLAISLIYGIVLFAFAAHASRIKSTRGALSQVAPQLSAENRQIGFFSHNSYSFYYYARSWQKQLGLPIDPFLTTLEQVEANPPRNLMVNRGDIKRFPSELSEKYNLRGDYGKWKWWERK